jgi:hypothetical protein
MQLQKRPESQNDANLALPISLSNFAPQKWQFSSYQVNMLQ